MRDDHPTTHRFDLAAALAKSLVPVPYRELQSRNVGRVRLLKADDLQGSIRDAIDRALAPHREELRRLRGVEARALTETNELRRTLEAREKETKSLCAEAVAAKADLEAARASAGGAFARAEHVEAEAARLNEDLLAARNELARAEAELGRAEAELGRFRVEIQRAGRERDEARGRLAESLVDRERMRTVLSTERTQELEPPVAGAWRGEREGEAALRAVAAVASDPTPAPVAAPGPEVASEEVVDPTEEMVVVVEDGEADEPGSGSAGDPPAVETIVACEPPPPAAMPEPEPEPEPERSDAEPVADVARPVIEDAPIERPRTAGPGVLGSVQALRGLAAATRAAAQVVAPAATPVVEAVRAPGREGPAEARLGGVTEGAPRAKQAPKVTFFGFGGAGGLEARSGAGTWRKPDRRGGG